MFYNVIGFILAGFGILTPILAVLFQEAGCITVVFSSTLLLWAKTQSTLKEPNGDDILAVNRTIENAMRDNVSQCAKTLTTIK
jgi:hypothetical protein